MSRSRVVLRNIASNWLGFAIQAAVVFFLTPFVLRELGDARYGVWILTSTMTGYYGLLAFGMTGGITQYLTRYLAMKEFGKMNEVASTAASLLTGLGIMVSLSSFVLAALAPRLFDIPEEFQNEVFWCIIVVGGTIAVQFSLFLYSAVLVATQRYDLSNLIGVCGTLLDALLVFAALRNGYGLIGLCLAKSASDLIGFGLRVLLAYRVLPQLNVRVRLFSIATMRMLLSYGTWSFIISIAHSIFTHIDALVIGALMPLNAVSHYALAAGVGLQRDNVLRPIDRVFFPTLTDLHAKEDTNGLRSLYVRGSRLYLLIVAIVVSTSICWSDDFFRLWIGDRYLSNPDYPSVATLFTILSLATIGRLAPALGGQVLQAALLVRPLALVAVTEAVLNAILSILLGQLLGLAGVAIATLVAVIVVRTFVIPLMVSRFLGITVWAYMRQAVIQPLIVGSVFYPCAVGIRESFIPTNFGLLLINGVLAVFAGSVIAAVIGLSRAERVRYLYQPAGVVWRMFFGDRRSRPSSPG